ETVAIGGIPVELVDTAGIRRALDEAESIGIKKSMEALADADLVLVVMDRTQALSEEDCELLRQVEGRPAIVVENKSDLASAGGETHLAGPNPDKVLPQRIPTSALTGWRADFLPASAIRSWSPTRSPRSTPRALPSRLECRTRCSCSICTRPCALSTKSPAPPPPTTSLT